MSRVGSSPVTVPEGVTVELNGNVVTAKGKLGELSATLTNDVKVEQADGQVTVTPLAQHKRARQMWGTARSLIDGLVVGVSEGFEKKLEINGVGYRAQVQGKDVVLQLGYSHEIRYPIPEGIKIEAPEQNQLIISGASKQRVGQVASEIRAMRPPEPYKGKGVKYADEYILRKEGKKK
ncbi:MAG: 50S ribosomal protein L6 [Rhodospirillales bacterium]|nr:50S ribosomal protein L6 [Rhodospirillales bacterium]MBO6786413.1 50S ribosomal protein L6 [Rhodospirillales bacterium]